LVIKSEKNISNINKNIPKIFFQNGSKKL